MDQLLLVFFSGWGNLISKYDRIKLNKDHIAWTLLIFGLLLDFWTGSWPRERFITISINYFILSLLVPMSFYGLTAVLFPIIKSGHDFNFDEFYNSHKKIMYVFFGITMLANTVSANLMEQKLFELENLFRLVAIVFSVIAFFTKRVEIERFILIFGWGMLILHVFIELQSQ